jgi:hypothetical protein
MRETYSLHLAIFVGIFVFILTVIFALIRTSEFLLQEDWVRYDIPHPIEGYEQCDTCHGLGAEYPYPKNHQGWNNQSCTKCHQLSEENSAVFQKRPGERYEPSYSAVYNNDKRTPDEEVNSRSLPAGSLLRTTQNSPTKGR